MKDFLELAEDRYSVRKFDGREIPREDIDKIIEAGICAPTAVNFQPFRIWVFKSEEAREKLLSCTKMQFIEPAKVIFMIGSKAMKRGQERMIIKTLQMWMRQSPRHI